MRAGLFRQETHHGKAAACDIAARKGELEEMRTIRHIQAYTWRQDMGSEPARALAPERSNLLTVHIGPAKQPRLDPAFPERQIDFTAGPVGVTVQLELAGASMAALGKNEHFLLDPMTRPLLMEGINEVPVQLFQLLDKLLAPAEPATTGKSFVGLASDDIILPAAGDSTTAFFAVRPQTGVKEVQGRIAIIHQNRIVQTALLTVRVDARADDGPGIRVDTEAGVHPRLDDLAERRQFDVALIAADDIGSRLRLTVSCDGTSQEVYVDNLEAAVKNIQASLLETFRRTEEEDTLALNSDKMRIILRSLAQHGRLLYDSLNEELGNKLEGDRFQLVCRGKAFFPLEYVYDGPRPKESARVCPEAADNIGGEKGCLRGDKCGACPHEGSKDYLCPLHFWGLSKVIERHGKAPKDQRTGSVGVDRIKLPSPTRSPFGPVQPVLFAASKRAFAFSDGSNCRKELLRSLTRLGGGTAPVEAKTWDQWREAVKSTNPPNVLVLLPHTNTIPINMDVLEIEDEEQLLKDEIDVDVVGPSGAVQLLLLLGCAAAQVRASFAPYPFLFRDFGADIVIAPLEAILGADAVPIGRQIADLLANSLSTGREIAFGELLRDLRRGLLAEGHPGVLGLVGFGDADWVFGG